MQHLESVFSFFSFFPASFRSDPRGLTCVRQLESADHNDVKVFKNINASQGDIYIYIYIYGRAGRTVFSLSLRSGIIIFFFKKRQKKRKDTPSLLTSPDATSGNESTGRLPAGISRGQISGWAFCLGVVGLGAELLSGWAVQRHGDAARRRFQSCDYPEVSSDRLPSFFGR